jgi:hypothetical protein
MKQHITQKQFLELSDKHQEFILRWCMERDYYIFGIGQMIEFLDERGSIELDNENNGWLIGYWYKGETTPIRVSRHELCDALWETVKEILEK